jgi:hypothetical protein
VLNSGTNTISDFSASHPEALFISYQHDGENMLPKDSKIYFSHEYRGKNVILWQMENRIP